MKCHICKEDAHQIHVLFGYMDLCLLCYFAMRNLPKEAHFKFYLPSVQQAILAGKIQNK